MSSPALLETMLGGFAYFAPKGVTVGTADPVDYNAKPAFATSDNKADWAPYSLGTILNFAFDTEEDKQPYMEPSVLGGYVKRNRNFTTQEWCIIQTRQMQEIIWRLQYGLNSKIVDATGQSPGADRERFLDGWLKLVPVTLGATTRYEMDWWCELRLESKQKWDNKVAEPSLRFTLYRTYNGANVSLNTIKFAAGS